MECPSDITKLKNGRKTHSKVQMLKSTGKSIIFGGYWYFCSSTRSATFWYAKSANFYVLKNGTSNASTKILKPLHLSLLKHNVINQIAIEFNEVLSNVIILTSSSSSPHCDVRIAWGRGYERSSHLSFKGLF